MIIEVYSAMRRPVYLGLWIAALGLAIVAHAPAFAQEQTKSASSADGDVQEPAWSPYLG